MVSIRNTAPQVPEFEQAYSQFRGLFFHAVSKLVAQGFVVPPDEVLDLIHDFFLDEWQGLRERYEPGKSQFSTYVYAAFFRFARRRTIVLQRFRNSLYDSKEIARLMEMSGHVDVDLAQKHDIDVLADVLVKLRPLQKDLLLRYAENIATSERVLAEEYSLSRYKVRTLLVDAFGTVAVSLGTLSLGNKLDWDIAVAVWKHGRSIDEAAAVLGISPDEAQAAQGRNRKAIAGAITAIHQESHKFKKRSLFMSESNLTLLRTVLSSRNPDILPRVREHAEELVEALDDSEFVERIDLKSIDPEWLAAIYESLAEGLSSKERIAESTDALYQAFVDDQAAVGKAFREVLVPIIPDVMSELFKSLRQLPPIEKSIQALIWNEADVRTGLPESEQLVPYGITPLALLHSTDALSMLLKRAIRRDLFRRDLPLFLSIEQGVTSEGSEMRLEPGVLAHEISVIANCRNDVARVLFPWTIQAAGFVPYLFSGFESTPKKNGVELSRADVEYRDLYQRWGLLKPKRSAA